MARNNDNFYSDENYRRLQKIVGLFKELHDSVSDAGKYTQLYGKMNQELAKLGYQWDAQKTSLKTVEKLIQSQYEQVKAIKDQHSELLNIDEEFNLMWDKANDKNLDNYLKLLKIKRETKQLNKDITKSDDERKKLIVEQSKAYTQIEKSLRKTERGKNIKQSMVKTAFGVTGDQEQAFNDGVYGLKLVADVFSKAVNLFSDAVKKGIDENYNTTEATLNSVMASNSRRARWV